jgi:hypothetical protein
VASETGDFFDASMRKHQLYTLIELKRPREKIYKTDRILKTCRHVAHRLPPYNCDLSAIELAWATVERFITDSNVGAEFYLNRLRDFTAAGVASETKDDWKRYYYQVKTIEEAYEKRTVSFMLQTEL